jgi:hypothetical protein
MEIFNGHLIVGGMLPTLLRERFGFKSPRMLVEECSKKKTVNIIIKK